MRKTYLFLITAGLLLAQDDTTRRPSLTTLSEVVFLTGAVVELASNPGVRHAVAATVRQTACLLRSLRPCRTKPTVPPVEAPNPEETI